MGMKKQIYNLFTVEHGIILNSAVISYIEQKINTNDELLSFLSAFKTHFNSSSITKEQVDAILNSKSEVKNFYNIQTFKFKHRDLCKEFEHFKNKLHIKTTPIALLEEGVEDVIFGIFYRNAKGTFSLEDDYDVIDLQMNNVTNSVFLFDGMFVGAKGVKNGSFIISEFILPEPHISKKQNQFLVDLKPKICVFNLKNSSCNSDLDAISSILSFESPNIVIIFSNENIDITPLKIWCRDIIISSIVEDSDFLSSTPFGVSNPFILETFDCLFGFIAVNIFKNRQNGLFFNKTPMDSFIKSVLSQNSLYPFGNCDLRVSELPNIFVFLQDFHPLVKTIDSVRILSLPCLKDNYYAVLDLFSETFEIKVNSRLTSKFN